MRTLWCILNPLKQLSGAISLIPTVRETTSTVADLVTVLNIHLNQELSFAYYTGAGNEPLGGTNCPPVCIFGERSLARNVDGTIFQPGETAAIVYLLLVGTGRIWPPPPPYILPKTLHRILGGSGSTVPDTPDTIRISKGTHQPLDVSATGNNVLQIHQLCQVALGWSNVTDGCYGHQSPIPLQVHILPSRVSKAGEFLAEVFSLHLAVTMF